METILVFLFSSDTAFIKMGVTLANEQLSEFQLAILYAKLRKAGAAQKLRLRGGKFVLISRDRDR